MRPRIIEVYGAQSTEAVKACTGKRAADGVGKNSMKTTVYRADGPLYVQNLKEGECHVVLIGMIGMTYFSHYCEYGAGIEQREQETYTFKVNESKETGTLFPKANITILPCGFSTNSFVTINSREYVRDGKYGAEAIENHVRDAFVAERDFVRSGLLVFDLRFSGVDDDQVCVYNDCIVQLAETEFRDLPGHVVVFAPDAPTKRLVNRLIDIARLEAFDQLEGIGGEFLEARSGQFMRQASEVWYRIFDALPREDVIFLIKSLTFIERFKPFIAGSVSPVIWLFSRLADFDAKTDLIEWILENTDNCYLPFGKPNHGAKSLAEFQRITRDIEARVQAQRDAESARQLVDQNRKAARASELIFNAIRRKDSKAVVALLARGADRNAVDADGQTAEEYAQTMGLGGLFL